MKNKVIVCFIMLVLICYVLCGCQNPIYNQGKKIEVKDFKVRTIQSVHAGESTILVPYNNEFMYHPNMTRYEMKATLKKTDDIHYDALDMTVVYLDINKKELGYVTFRLEDFKMGVWDYEWVWILDLVDYFEQIDTVKIYFRTFPS